MLLSFQLEVWKQFDFVNSCKSWRSEGAGQHPGCPVTESSASIDHEQFTQRLWPSLRTYRSRVCVGVSPATPRHNEHTTAQRYTYSEEEEPKSLCNLDAQTLGWAHAHWDIILMINRCYNELWHHQDELHSPTKWEQMAVLKNTAWDPPPSNKGARTKTEDTLMLHFIFPACFVTLLPPHQGCEEASVLVQLGKRGRLVTGLASGLL